MAIRLSPIGKDSAAMGKLTLRAYATVALKGLVILLKQPKRAYAIGLRHELTPLAFPRAYASWPGPAGGLFETAHLENQKISGPPSRASEKFDL